VAIEVFPRTADQFGRQAYLASVAYNPGTFVQYNTASVTLADVDATNLKITFVAPASGSVMVDLTGLALTNASGTWAAWAIMLGGVMQQKAFVSSTPGSGGLRCFIRFSVTGLVPGQSYTYTWAHQTNVAASTVSLLVGATYGSAVMTVTDGALSQLGYVNGGIWAGPQTINVGDPAAKALVLRMAAGQTGNAFEIRSAADALISSVGPTGLTFGGVETHTFAQTGVIAVGTGKSRIYFEGNFVIDTVRAAVGTAPTGASLIIDVNKNATTIYTTQSARPTIAIGAFTATGNSPAITTFALGDYMTVDVDQVGSTIAGSDLTVAIRVHPV
jgi:hypothetical protein